MLPARRNRSRPYGYGRWPRADRERTKRVGESAPRRRPRPQSARENVAAWGNTPVRAIRGEETGRRHIAWRTRRWSIHQAETHPINRKQCSVPHRNPCCDERTTHKVGFERVRHPDGSHGVWPQDIASKGFKRFEAKPAAVFSLLAGRRQTRGRRGVKGQHRRLQPAHRFQGLPNKTNAVTQDDKLFILIRSSPASR
jgi:hypothetical protein